VENERLFGVSVERLLTVDGVKKLPQDIYRKIRPKKPVSKLTVNWDKKEPLND
jgi:hypothetical protein